jgi:hypothetical protein
MNVKRIIDLVEKSFLVLIARFTVAAMGQEVILLISKTATWNSKTCS